MMHPILLLPVGVGLAWWWTSRKSRNTSKPTANTSTKDLPPETRGPFDGPGGEPPSAPTAEPTPTPTPEPAFPGPYRPQDPDGEYGPVPVTIYATATAGEIEQWPGHERHVFISDDCQTVLIGSDWIASVFIPAAARLTKEAPERYHSVAAITWEILVGPFADRSGPNHAIDCLRMIPDYSLSTFTNHGTFTQYTDDISAYNAAWETFESQYVDLANFYTTLHGELSNHPQIKPILDANWGDGPKEG